MTGMRIAPSAEVSATAEPEMPPNSIEEKTFTAPRPPRTLPTAAAASRTSRAAMPPCSISSPAKMKNGIASSEKTETPERMRWNATKSGSPS